MSKFLVLIKNIRQLRKTYPKFSKEELTKTAPHICFRENPSISSVWGTQDVNGISPTVSLCSTDTHAYIDVPKSFQGQ